MKSISDFNHEIPGVADHRPLPERIRAEREARESLIAMPPLPEPAREIPPPSKSSPAPKKPAKQPTEVTFTIGTTRNMRRTKFTVYCSHDECRDEFSGPLFALSDQLNAVTERGAASWSIVLGTTGQIEAYCYKHKAPKKATVVKIVEERLDF